MSLVNKYQNQNWGMKFISFTYLLNSLRGSSVILCLRELIGFSIEIYTSTVLAIKM